MNTNSVDEKSNTSCSEGSPVKPKIFMDEDGEEVTRKIAPTMIMPSLGPLPTMPETRSSVVKPTVFQKRDLVSSETIQKLELRRSETKSTLFSWKLSAVPVLPELHSLEKTATFVPNALPIEVSSRISDVLRERSIEAQYENEKAKVKCTTVEGVDFRIRLYRGRGRYNHGIIVEVQRRFGNSYVFHSDTQAILDGAQGKDPAPLAPLMTRGSNILPKVSHDDECENTFSAVLGSGSSLEMVAKVMEVPGFDAQYLGLQMLLPLVTSERLTFSTARVVASSLFGEYWEIGEKVINYIIKDGNRMGKKGTKRGVFDDDEEDDNDENFEILRNASLDILANALKAYGRVPEHIRETLRTALLQNLHAAEEHPNTAFLSANCLEFFIQEDYNGSRLKSAFAIAQQVGEDRHLKLMHQAQKCMILCENIVR